MMMVIFFMEAGRLEGWTARKACNVASRANWQTSKPGNTRAKVNA